MATLESLPAARPALPAGRQLLVLLLLGAAHALDRIAARLARPAAPERAAVVREVMPLGGADGGALGVYEDGRLVGVIDGVQRL